MPMDFDHLTVEACLPHDGQTESSSQSAESDVGESLLEFVAAGTGIDESAGLAEFFDTILTDRNGAITKAVVRTRTAGDSIFLDKIVTLYAGNTDVDFRARITLGANGGLRIMGDQPEVLRNSKTLKASLRAQATAGTNILQLSSSSPTTKMNALVGGDFQVGDVIVLRGQNDVYGKALTKQVVHVASIDTASNNLILKEELEYTFETTYPTSDWPADLTTGTTIAVAAYAALTVNAAVGDVKIRVNRSQLESSGIVAGSVVLVSTNETEGDISVNAHSTTPSSTSTDSETIGTGSKTFTVASSSGFAVNTYVRARNSATIWMAGRVTAISGNDITLDVVDTSGSGTLASWTLQKPYRNAARLEWKIVRSIAVVDADESDVTFDSPLIDVYTTARYGGIQLITPVVNSIFRGVRATYNADQASKNTHGVQLGYGYKSYLIDCHIDGSGGQKGNGVRISNCLECGENGCRVSNPKFFASSEGYGHTFYYSDRCWSRGCDAEGCRHNFLIQKANNTQVAYCKSVNDLISGFDVHGVRSINTHFMGCVGIGGPGLSADATHKSIFRVGNTSHAAGDLNTLIEGCFVNGAPLSGSIDSYAALEVFGASSDVALRSSFITDCHTGIRLGYDNRTVSVTGNTTSGSPTIANVSTGGLITGLPISGSGIPNGAMITAVGATTLTISANATATATAVALTILAEPDPAISIREDGNTWKNITVPVDAATDYGDGELIVNGRKQVNGVTTTDYYLTSDGTGSGSPTTIPIDGSIPTNAEGREVLTTTWTPKALRTKLTFVVPTIEIDSSGAVIAAVFIDGVFSFAWVHRVTSGATPPDGIMAQKVIALSAGAHTISVRMGSHSTGRAIINPAGNNWGDNTRVCPYLIISE